MAYFRYVWGAKDENAPVIFGYADVINSKSMMLDGVGTALSGGLLKGTSKGIVVRMTHPRIDSVIHVLRFPKMSLDIIIRVERSSRH